MLVRARKQHILTIRAERGFFILTIYVVEAVECNDPDECRFNWQPIPSVLCTAVCPKTLMRIQRLISAPDVGVSGQMTDVNAGLIAYNIRLPIQRGGFNLKFFKTKEPVEEFETSVWVCNKENCLGWIREEFSFKTTPICIFCKSEMVHTTKMLPVLTNTFKGNFY
jgi:hypothetical protein